MQKISKFIVVTCSLFLGFVFFTAMLERSSDLEKNMSATLTEKDWVFLISAAQEKSYKEAAPVLEKLVPQLQKQMVADTTNKKK